MPADDARGPTGRAASIGFYANADDSLRVVADSTRPSRGRRADAPAAAGAPRGSVVIVVLATLLLAGTAIGFAWTLTPAGRPTPDGAPATAAVQLPPEAPPAAELPAPAPAIEAPAPAQPPDLAGPHRAPAAQALKPAADHPVRHAAARRHHRPATDLANSYARAIDEHDRRQAQAAGDDPPF